MTCCNPTKGKVIAVGVVAIVFLIITATLLGLLANFDSLVEKKIEASVRLTPGSAVYDNWVEPSTPIHFSIYLFNITNADKIVKGEKPRVEQIGPYVYREQRVKTNISWPNGDYSQIKFYQRLIFYFDRDLSVGDPHVDKVIGISAPLVSLAANMKAGNGPSSTEYSLLTFFYTPKLFVKQTVNDYLWGYTDPITDGCNSLSPEKCPSAKTGVMFGKNNTDDGPFLVDTGLNDISQVGQIREFKGSSKVDCWASEEANTIIGTDGSNAAPNLNESSTTFLFAYDLCRSFQMKVGGPAKLTNSDKVPVFTLVGTPETGQPVHINPKNLGYCPPKTPGPKCPPQGLFDISACKMQGGTYPPVYTSQLYFYQADPSLRAAIDGLPEPDPVTSPTKVYIQPRLGLVLEAYKRVQINFLVRPHTEMADLFKEWKNDTFLPVVWFEEKAVADKQSLDMLYEGVFVMPQKGYRMLLVVFGICLALFLLVIILLMWCICGLKKNSTNGGKEKTGAVTRKNIDGAGDSTNGKAKYAKVSQQEHVTVHT